MRILPLVLAGMLFASRAAAAPDVSEAKKYFDAGLQFYKAGQLTEALASFLEANRLSPRESIQRNIAQTHRDLHDFASAYAAYDELLARYGETMKPAERTNVEKARTELAALTGLLSITVPDPEVTITVDGKDCGHPPAAIRLNVGTHIVVLSKPDHEPAQSSVEIVGHDAPIIADAHLVPIAHDVVPAEPPPPTVVVVPAPAPPPPPPPPAPAAAPPPPVRGLYTRFAIAPLFPTGHHDTVEDHSVYGRTVPTSGGGLYGAGLDVRVGYDLGEVGIEGTIAGQYDHASVTARPVGHTDDWSFHRAGGSFAVGARWLPTKLGLGVVQPTVGGAIGISGRAIGASRVVEDSTTKDRPRFSFYVTPSFFFDAGVVIGHVPGGRLFVGLLTVLDLPASQSLASAQAKRGSFPIPAGAQVRVATGPELAIGPSVGLVLGH